MSPDVSERAFEEAARCRDIQDETGCADPDAILDRVLGPTGS